MITIVVEDIIITLYVVLGVMFICIIVFILGYFFRK